MLMSRRAFLFAAASTAALGLETDDAEAKRKKNPPPRKGRLKNEHKEATKTQAFYFVQGMDGSIVRAHGQDQRHHPASLTKILTLYTVMDAMKNHPKAIGMDTEITVPDSIVNSEFKKYGIWSTGRIKAGKTYTAEKLMMTAGTKSCAASTHTIAHHVGKLYMQDGDKDPVTAFVRQMNACAQKIGMKDSVFCNPVGVPNPAHYSTTRDMAKLAFALQRDFPTWAHRTMGLAHPDLEPLVGAKQSRHSNDYLRANPKNVLFGKTGYTHLGGHCLLTAAKINDGVFVAVVINGRSEGERVNLTADGFAAARKGERLFLLPDNPPLPASRPEQTVALPAGVFDYPLPAKLTVSKPHESFFSRKLFGPANGFFGS